MTDQKDLDTVESKKFVLKGRMEAESLYVDGVTQILFGFPVSKLLFHSTIELPNNESNRELRKAVQYLTMPTVSAIDMANIILTFAKKSEGRLKNDLDENSWGKVEEILKNFHSTSFGGDVEIQETVTKVITEAKKKK